MANYEVIVQNIGKVFDGENGFQAHTEYQRYVGKSKRNEGRASGEGVTLWKDGEIIKEYDAPDHWEARS